MSNLRNLAEVRKGETLQRIRHRPFRVWVERIKFGLNLRRSDSGVTPTEYDGNTMHLVKVSRGVLGDFSYSQINNVIHFGSSGKRRKRDLAVDRNLKAHWLFK